MTFLRNQDHNLINLAHVTQLRIDTVHGSTFTAIHADLADGDFMEVARYDELHQANAAMDSLVRQLHDEVPVLHLLVF